MNKKYIGILLVFLMVSTAITVVDTVSAAKYKKIDSGKAFPEKGMKVTWNSYHNGKTVKTNYYMYVKPSGKKKYSYIGKIDTWLTKKTKNKLKFTVNVSSKFLGSYKSSGYEKTRLSVNSYYFKRLKPELKRGLW